MPEPNDIGIVIVGEEFKTRDIIRHSRDNTIGRINELHRSYDALHPVLSNDVLCKMYNDVE